MKSRVAILRTAPATALRDYRRLLQLAGLRDALPADRETALKINVSWHFFYPGCSTTPWQLEGVIRAMKSEGYDPARIHACHNRTVVMDARLGERENKQLPVIEAHGLRNVHLYEPDAEWVHIRDVAGDVADRLMVLNQVYPDGFLIPREFIGSNILHLPTVKTHVFTVTTGAMKNAFGGLLNEQRHWVHPVIHEALVDLLRIQQRIHSGIFAVMDGTFAGDGPGPRCIVPHVKNVILASADQVAIDAVAAKLMGFDPLRDLKYVRLAHEAGLGCGDPREIEIAGDADAAGENWHFNGPFKKMTFASRMQHRIYWGPLKRPIEWSLKTVLAPWSYIASVLYHDSFWYPTHYRTMLPVLQSPWGRLFQAWEAQALPPDDLDAPGWDSLGEEPLELRREGWKLFGQSMRILASSLREAPEFAARRRRAAARSAAAPPTRD